MVLILLLCLESLNDDETHLFLLILYHLVSQLSVSAVHSATDADDSDSDEAVMDVDCQVHFITYSSHTHNMSMTPGIYLFGFLPCMACL